MVKIVRHNTIQIYPARFYTFTLRKVKSLRKISSFFLVSSFVPRVLRRCYILDALKSFLVLMMKFKSIPTDKNRESLILKGGSWQKGKGKPFLLGLKKS